jgi:hypothetical protein
MEAVQASFLFCEGFERMNDTYRYFLAPTYRPW